VNVVGGIAIGLVAAVLLVEAFKRLVGDDVVGVVTSLAAGYIAYIPAEEIGVSGVLAAVVVGLIVGYRSPALSTPASRLRGYGFWEVLVFLLNAVLFVLVGLQLPGILSAQDRSALELIGLALAVSAVVVGTRLVWVNTMPYVIRALDRRPAQVARRVGWRMRQVAGWSGLRGSVSLAAALALPHGFPERDLLIFLTLAVIFATLVAQGLTLPLLIRRLGIHDDGAGEREELHARREAADAAIAQLRRLNEEDWTREDSVSRMIALYEFRHRRLSQRAGKLDGDEEDDLDERSRGYQRMVREVLDAQRRRIIELRNEGVISDEVMHALERELDLEDQRLEI
jgi:Na+/H+ antiporter